MDITAKHIHAFPSHKNVCIAGLIKGEGEIVWQSFLELRSRR